MGQAVTEPNSKMRRDGKLSMSVGCPFKEYGVGKEKIA